MHWEISREKIRLLQQLGIGEFGAVYDAEVTHVLIIITLLWHSCFCRQVWYYCSDQLIIVLICSTICQLKL